MKYSNKYNLPEAVYNAICRDEYTKGDGDYSVTEILNPPQQVQLIRRHSDKLTEDVMDNVWSLFGKAAHHILEQHGADDAITEERMYVEVMGKKIGGQVDSYHAGVITDYKITSAWTLVYGRNTEKWEQQVNCYAYIFRQNGLPVERLQVVAILRDWDKNKAKQDRTYPQTPIQIVPLNLWDEEKAFSFLNDKMQWHVQAETLADDELALVCPCLPEETWEQPTKYAVMKEGRKTAVRVFDDIDEAQCYLDQNYIEGMYIQQRAGKRTRCEQYCSCSAFCHQYKEYCNVSGN